VLVHKGNNNVKITSIALGSFNSSCDICYIVIFGVLGEKVWKKSNVLKIWIIHKDF